MSVFINWKDNVAPALEEILLDLAPKLFGERVDAEGASYLSEDVDGLPSTKPSSLPSFLGKTVVKRLELGEIEPEITVVNITSVDSMFYEALNELQTSEDAVENPFDSVSVAPSYTWSRASTFDSLELSSSDSSSSSSPEELDADVQLHVLVSYNGKSVDQTGLTISLETSLVLWQFGVEFLTLPLQVSLTDLVFEAEVVLSYLSKRKQICVTVLRVDRSAENMESAELVDDSSLRPQAFAEILKDLSIHSEVGNAQRKVLKNASKIERFLLEQTRKYIAEELVWPNFQVINLKEKPSLGATGQTMEALRTTLVSSEYSEPARPSDSEYERDLWGVE